MAVRSVRRGINQNGHESSWLGVPPAPAGPRGVGATAVAAACTDSSRPPPLGATHSCSRPPPEAAGTTARLGALLAVATAALPAAPGVLGVLGVLGNRAPEGGAGGVVAGRIVVGVSGRETGAINEPPSLEGVPAGLGSGVILASAMPA